MAAAGTLAAPLILLGALILAGPTYMAYRMLSSSDDNENELERRQQFIAQIDEARSQRLQTHKHILARLCLLLGQPKSLRECKTASA